MEFTDIAIFGMFLVLSGLFSGSEVAVLSISRARLKLLAGQGKTAARVLDDMLRQPSRLLATILIGNNFANASATSLATVMTTIVVADITGNAEHPAVVPIATIVATIFLLVVGEITPKGSPTTTLSRSR
jgi:putative hemolysin